MVIEVQAFKSKLWPAFQGKKTMLIVVKIDYLNFFKILFKFTCLDVHVKKVAHSISMNISIEITPNYSTLLAI